MTRSRTPRQIDVAIESLGSDGFGSGQIGERQVRVKNALVGESVSARVLKRRKGEWLAEAFAVESIAKERRQPPCAYFPRCGGCAMQHLDQPAQLVLKQDHLLGALASQGVAPGRIRPATLGPRFNYRSKARLGVRVVGGEVLVGFRESFSSRVNRMDDCFILTAELAALITPLKELLQALTIAGRIPQIELAAGDSATALILRHLEPITRRDLARIDEFARNHRVRCFGQSGGYETITPISANAQQPYLSYGNADYGLHFLFRPADFTQVNLAMNRKLVRAALAGLRAPAGARVLDLFCGIGNFTLALAAAGLEAVGIEAAVQSIERARMNADHNGLGGRCEFVVQDLYDADCLNLGRAEYLLLDPPRSGAGPNLPAWVDSSGARRIAYVSCSPESFAVDAEVLCRIGFELEEVGIFDMFPHTAHVETLGVFQKRW